MGVTAVINLVYGNFNTIYLYEKNMAHCRLQQQLTPYFGGGNNEGRSGTEVVPVGRALHHV